MCSGSQLCPTLSASEKCIRLRQYKAGRTEELFHQHVRAPQLADGAIPDLLRTLVLRFKEAGADEIVQSHLTRRGRLAKTPHPLRITVDYPEPGVIRRYCGGNVEAWVDVVILPEKFRVRPQSDTL